MNFKSNEVNLYDKMINYIPFILFTLNKSIGTIEKGF